MSTPSFVHLVRYPLVPVASPPLLLLLHGIGSNEEDLFQLAPFLDERLLIVAVRAPHPYYGPGSFAWFHVQFIPGQTPIADLEEAETSRRRLLAFLDELHQIHEYDRRSVMVGGFSQGAMMSLLLGLNDPHRFTGIVALSGRVPEVLLERHHPIPEFVGKPVFQSHGLFDDIITIDHARSLRHALTKLRFDLDYREYPMGHEINQACLVDASQWITSVLDSGYSESNSDR